VTLEDGTERLSRNVGKITTQHCVISQNKTDLIYIVVEAWNYADQKQPENAEYLNCLGSMTTNDARCT
jgi:hypothetical protein